MIVATALQHNLDKVQAAARDVERLEERAGRLRAAMLQVLVQTSTAVPADGEDTLRFTR